MLVVLKIYAFLLLAVVLGLGAMVLLRGLHLRRRVRREALEEEYLRIVMCALVEGPEDTPSFPEIHRASSRLLLSKVLAGVISATYGLDMELMRQIVARHGLDNFLMRRVHCSWGYRRAYYLSLLMSLPIDEATVRGVTKYALSNNTYVRFYVLMTRMAHDPSTALRLISEYPLPLTAFELSEIMSMLRRGVLPVAYKPLLSSPNRNLRAVGLAIVRQFSIEEAEPNLLRVVGDDEEAELGREALYILCGMRRPLLRRAVVRRVSGMNGEERKALLRYMALEGYSADGLNRLFGVEECPYYHALVRSYKRCLACS